MDEKSFSELNLDDRLLKGISKLGWQNPSKVQEKAIPLIITGKDVIARAKTGSGKTAAYLLPLLQKLLVQKQSGSANQQLFGLVLAPSKELCKQACQNVSELAAYCSKSIAWVDLANTSVQHASTITPNADFVITTPSKLLAHINNGSVQISTVQYVVVDEADMMFSYGFENDIRELVNYLPKIYQAILVSATISQDVDSLKGLILHSPVVLKLQESDLPESERLVQYVVKCEAADKFLLAYSLFKLKLVRGKTLVFVNSLDKCYRLKLFLEQFFIKSCVINAELPQNSRLHIVDQFNRGVYDIVIATDSASTISTGVSHSASVGKKVRKSSKKGDKEFNVSRGIDFQNVDNVLNFDFPSSVDSYVHRVGRTARGDNTGTALSLVASNEDSKWLKQVEEKLSSSFGQSVLKPYNFKMDQVDGFRYRVNDAMATITKVKVKEARMKEIKSEIITSEKLKSYFSDNPKDLKILRHDKVLAPTSQKPQLKHVPDYLVPESLKHIITKPGKKRKKNWRPSVGGKEAKRRREDPLKSFKYKKRGK